MSGQPTISVLVPTCARIDLLERCLSSILREIAEFDEGDVEIIVSNDGDPNDLVLVQKRFSGAIFLRGPQQGPARNRNHAARAAKGDWLVFIDDDCIASPGWLSAYSARFSGADVLEGKTIADRKRIRFDEESPVNERGGFLWSCNFAIRRELFEEMGGFDEDYPFAAMEDVDLRLRLEARKAKFQFVETAVVLHPYRRVSGMKMTRRRLDSHFIFWEKHKSEQPSNHGYFFFFLAARSFLKVTLPGIFRYRGRGLVWRLSHDLVYFQYALLCWLRIRR